MSNSNAIKRSGFRWSNALTVDQKANRLVLPDRVRELHGQNGDSSKTYYVGCEQRGRLFLHDEDQHQRYVDELLQILSAGRSEFHLPRRQEAMLSRILGRFQRVSCDSQGRMTLPRELLDLAGIVEKVVLVVLPHRTEVWSETALAAFEAEFNDEDLLAELDALRASQPSPAPALTAALEGA